jgi:hypothetical protein
MDPPSPPRYFPYSEANGSSLRHRIVFLKDQVQYHLPTYVYVFLVFSFFRVLFTETLGTFLALPPLTPRRWQITQFVTLPMTRHYGKINLQTIWARGPMLRCRGGICAETAEGCVVPESLWSAFSPGREQTATRSSQKLYPALYYLRNINYSSIMVTICTI